MPHHLSTFSSQFSPPPARHYHPTLSLWLSVDPMADQYPGVSPYVYCANNPVRLVDPDGKTVVPNDDDAKQLYSEYKSEVHKRLNNARESLSNLQQKKLEGNKISDRKIRAAQSAVNQYQTIADELEKMETSQIVFKIYTHTTGPSVTAYGSTTYNVATGEVNINVGDEKKQVVDGWVATISRIMIIAHELKHGFQYLKREIDFNQDGTQGGYLYDYTDEQAAIRRGAMFAFGTTININAFERAYGLGALQDRKDPRSYESLTPMQKESYDAQKAHGIYH